MGFDELEKRRDGETEIISEGVMATKRVEQLRVYQQGSEAAMEIFELSKSWPAEERYALTDQIRRSSRAVCANLAEGWRKRRYPRHFISKLSDTDAEASETRTWLRFAHHCGYLERNQYEQLDALYNQLCGGLVRMMQHPEKWRAPNPRTSEPEVESRIDP